MKSTGRLYQIKKALASREVLLELSLLVIVYVSIAMPFFNKCRNKNGITYADGKKAFEGVLAAIDDPLRIPENAYNRLWHRSRNTRLEENEEIAFGCIEDELVTKIMHTKAFPAMTKRINTLTVTILTEMRRQFKKDNDLFLEINFKEDEKMVMSNHQLESVFGELKYALTKTQNCDGERINQVVCAKTNSLIAWLRKLGKEKRDKLWSEARKKRKRITDEIRDGKKKAKRQRLEDARR
ncbi:Oidioi.mRNA.OKI2018_I69.YSR.g17038.t1.cds [Oikopleura dioica]|uniref:Oidioi.mRNA.OKI2018_I69.YSR.g17038.t1.cds n=1 Tax=Oikopleura dioica TaxID=34765 RepID=A0ABN7SII0_OIKDI|nr:Oidioi.mRNA.OKI2018_I69.YSR.g17038.t1.cds [Oikopleura dioica]